MFEKDKITVIAGPCAIENLEMLTQIARVLKDAGVSIIRGGAYKPRTSPYSFQGLEEEGLVYLKQISEEFGLKTVTEIIDTEHIDMVL